MGYHHAVSGAAVWLAASNATEHLSVGALAMSTPQTLAGMFLAAGAALLPDVDHHDATIAHALPGGRVVSGVAEALSGGHRHALHSLLAAAAAAVAALLIHLVVIGTPIGPVPVAAVAASTGLLAFAVKALRLAKGMLTAWVFGFAAAVAITILVGGAAGILVIAICLGFTTHLAGDMLTTGGVPLLWPLNPAPPAAVAQLPGVRLLWQPNGYFSVPVLGSTGSLREWAFGIALSAYTLWVLLLIGSRLFSVPIPAPTWLT